MIPSEAQIRAILSGPVKKTGHHLICNCWNCGREGKYYYNIENGFSDCKYESKGWNLYQFLQGWGALHLIEGNQVDVSALIHLATLGSTEVETMPILPDSGLPAGFKLLQWGDGSVYTAYLKSRKYTKQDFQLYQPGYTELIERYNGFVIIPVYKNWAVKGYIARNIDPESENRWQNKKNVKFNCLLDGYDELTVNTKVVIITEGHFDKVSVTTELGLHTNEEFKALASFGKKLSTWQIQMLLQTNVATVYFLYDMADAIRQIKQFGSILKGKLDVYGCYSHTLKDAGTMNQQELLRMLYNAQPIENYTLDVLQFNILK